MDVRDAIVAILDDQDTVVGTGFLVKDQTILTVAHVLEGLGFLVKIRFQGGTLSVAWAVRKSIYRDEDVAVLEAEHIPENIAPLPLRPLPDDTLTGKRVYSFGFSAAEDALEGWKEGTIQQETWPYLVAKDLPGIRPGMSGSPVFDSERQVVLGMLRGVRAEGTVHAITTSMILALLPDLRSPQPEEEPFPAGITLEVPRQVVSKSAKPSVERPVDKSGSDSEPAMAPVWHPRPAPKKKRSSRRLLNAGFVSQTGTPLDPSEALAGDSLYDLQVDVGPRWEGKLKSLVVKSAGAYFPEDKLPATTTGYLVRVVFVSEDFTPHQTTADLWVPAKKGQSFPVIDGKQAEQPGPVSLRLRTRPVSPLQPDRAYGRLCLYYKGQLIQSAAISAGIAREQGERLEEPNKAEIDYVLIGDFERSRHFVNRRIRFHKKAKARAVAVNITLNDDGAGHHRILATYHPNPKEELTFPPAWKPYDPQAAQNDLALFRKTLAECYEGLNENCGKSRARFGHDLQKLAILGDKLRGLAFSGLHVENEAGSGKLWESELLRTVEQGAVIQIARTGPSNYVFPWALIYEHPIFVKKPELCKVIREWDEAGTREKETEEKCPYHDEDWHAQDIVCPYGFWGLKHVIEQPLAALRKAGDEWTLRVTDRIQVSRNVVFGTGATNDIDTAARDLHIRRLAEALQAQLMPAKPADDRQSALDMLRAPEIVYFLCHGEMDKDQTPYLSIGEHVDHEEHKIYPDTLEKWGVLPRGGLDIKRWSEVRPLVFINACHSLQLRPGVVLNFVAAFADLGASGVIGTEVSVRADMALAIAEAILNRLAENMQVGQAVREMRWELLNRGNVLGLAYTPYGFANLHIQRRS